MSIVVALRSGDVVEIGCDTAIYEGDTLVGHGDKWVVHDHLAIGFAGDYSVGQTVLQDGLLDPVPTPAVLVRRIRKLFRTVGLETRDKKRTWDCEWLYVHEGKIWHIDSALSYSDCGEMAAIGSGSDVAKGAMWALVQNGWWVPSGSSGVADVAISAAMALSAHCGGASHTWRVAHAHHADG